MLILQIFLKKIKGRDLLLRWLLKKPEEKIKIKSNIKFEVTEFKHNRNKDSAESFNFKETSTPEEVDIL